MARVRCARKCEEGEEVCEDEERACAKMRRKCEVRSVRGVRVAAGSAGSGVLHNAGRTETAESSVPVRVCGSEGSGVLRIEEQSSIRPLV